MFRLLLISLSLFDTSTDSTSNPFEEEGDNVIHDMKASLRKNPFIVEKGPMTKSQEKRVKEAMRLLSQATIQKH